MPQGLPAGFTEVPDDLPPGFTAVDFKTTNAKDEAGNAQVDPNTLGTFVKHVGQQINPLAMVQAVGSALLHPVDTIRAVGAAQGALYDKAKDAYDAGDYPTAARHFVNYLLPLVGPGLDKSSDLFQAGKWAAGGGDAVGLGLAMFGPKALENVAAAKYPLGAAATGATPQKPVAPDVQFAQQRGVPLDAATVSDNSVVKGVQAMSDRSIGGSLVATPAKAEQAAAMARAGEGIAQDVHGAAMTPEQAGVSLRDALTAKMTGHTQAANAAYDKLRELEQTPAAQMNMPVTPKTGPVDAVTDAIKGEVRRIVHEMDAMPYNKRLLQPTKYGGSLEHVEGTGGAGASVFDDIKANMSAGANPTRGVVQSQLEAYLAGGPETPVVKAALEVGRDRLITPGKVGKPELPPSAGSIPTRLEAGRVTEQQMGFPVDLPETKRALMPLYEQMKRQMPITQQQANPGLKAIENILNSPDYAPLSQVDRDLSAIKKVAREQGGIAKVAVAKLDAAVQEAARNGGPDVVEALQNGRAATVAKYATSDVLDKLKDSSVRTIDALTQNRDVAIEQLRTVKQHVPEQIPVIARGYLEDLLSDPRKVSEWRKLGPQTKEILFPGVTADLDNFFKLTERMRLDVNPSGSGHQAILAGQVAALAHPATTIPTLGIEISANVLSRLLRSKPVIQALTRGMSLSVKTPPVVKAAAVANIVRTAKDAGVVLDFPKAADTGQ